MSTQSTAWALYAMSSYAAEMGGKGITGLVSLDGKSYRMETEKPFVSQTLLTEGASGKKKVQLTNNGSAPVYAVLSVTGTPEAGEEKAQSAGLSMEVRFIDEKGATLDVSSLERGQIFRAVAVISNKSGAAVKDIALSERFPSGWEIKNERVYKSGAGYPAGVSYQDYRDDRVFSFFDLASGQSITVPITLTATYPGRFYLPAVHCEAMYDHSVAATLPGRWIEVR